MFSIASLVTPMLLGVIIGAIASGRIPKDPRSLGDFVWPWMTPFCFAVGIFALALFAYLAAIYMTLEPADVDVRGDFRLRALTAGIALGVIAGIVLLLSIHGAPRIWEGLTERVWTWPLLWITSIGSPPFSRLRRCMHCGFGALRSRACALSGTSHSSCGDGRLPSSLYPRTGSRYLQRRRAPGYPAHLAGALTAGAFILFPSFWYLIAVFKSHRSQRHLWRRTVQVD
jgi:cytochrome d ubiquinol oxidase subunit II